jgi:hypothetical protein
MRADSLEQLQRGAEVVETVVIELTEEEEKIFQRLLDVVRHFDLGTTLRVAGGWVRDKVLSSLFSIFFLLNFAPRLAAD